MRLAPRGARTSWGRSGLPRAAGVALCPGASGQRWEHGVPTDRPQVVCQGHRPPSRAAVSAFVRGSVGRFHRRCSPWASPVALTIAKMPARILSGTASHAVTNTGGHSRTLAVAIHRTAHHTPATSAATVSNADSASQSKTSVSKSTRDDNACSRGTFRLAA